MPCTGDARNVRVPYLAARCCFQYAVQELTDFGTCDEERCQPFFATAKSDDIDEVSQQKVHVADLLRCTGVVNMGCKAAHG